MAMPRSPSTCRTARRRPSYGPSTFYLPAGEQHLTVALGAATAEETFPLAAGEIVEKDFIIGVGHATVNAFYVDGMRVEDGRLFVEIVAAKKAIDGTRKSFSYGYGPDSGHDIPPGDYVLIATMDQAVTEVPFTIAVGRRHRGQRRAQRRRPRDLSAGLRLHRDPGQEGHRRQRQGASATGTAARSRRRCRAATTR